MSLFKKNRQTDSVKKIEVPEKHFNLRVVLLAVSLAVGLVAIGWGVYYAFSKDPGWYTVEATPGEPSCEEEFKLQYNIGNTDMSATSEYKALERVYNQAVVDAYRLFNNEAENSELAKVSMHPNTEVTIDSGLYQALLQVENAKNRSIYLAPVYVEYDRVFIAEDEVNAKLYDPNKNPEAKEFVDNVLIFTADREMIDLELRGQNKAYLRVHDDYLAFAREYGIEVFLDFGWMRNAFVADYLAQQLQSHGFTHGNLTSIDGFVRNLDTGDLSYSYNLFNRHENTVSVDAVLDYKGPMSFVFLRNYPLPGSDRQYFAYSDGTITTSVVDPQTGLSSSAVNNLLGYSSQKGCAQILLELAPVYVAARLDEAQLEALAGKQTYCVWFRDGQLICTEENAAIRTIE